MRGRSSLSPRLTRPGGRPASTRGSLAIWSALLLAAAGIAGWTATGLPMPSTPAHEPTWQPVDAGAASMTAPGSWEPAPVGDAGLDGLGERAAAFAPVPGLSGHAVVAVLPFADATLVPAPLRGLAGPGRPQRGVLAGLAAWRYRQVALPKGRIAQLTVAPTTAGSVAVVCVADEAAWQGVQSCADDLTDARLRGAEPLVPSPTLAFRRELSPVLAKLDDRRGELRARLRGAPSRRAQAPLAARLGRAHGRALAALTASAPAAGSPRLVLRELRRSARFYRRLAVAARNGWPVRYQLARAAIGRSDRALAEALAAVR